MLETLSLRNLGPTDELDFEFAERLNVVTGDNGLGKTFVLEVAWWALTRCWAEERVIHPAVGVNEASIRYHVHGKQGPNSEVECSYRRDSLDWSPLPARRPPSPGLVIYARIDGGFSLWDPERNGGSEKLPDTQRKLDRPDAFQFSRQQLWDGLRDDNGTVICRGLLEDWEQKGVIGREFVESNGGKVVLAPLVEGKSSTDTIEKMKSLKKEKKK